MNKTFQTIKVLVLALVFSLGLSFVYAWTGPTSTPPAGNVPAPLNTGSGEQAKAGSLVIRGSLQVGNMSAGCSGARAGTIAYSAGVLKYCNGLNMVGLASLPAEPTVEVTTSVPTVAAGQSTALQISSTGATECRLTGGGLDQAVSVGSDIVLVTPTTDLNSGDDVTYTVTCSGAGGSAAASQIIDVRAYKALTGVGGNGAPGQSCKEFLRSINREPVNNSNILQYNPETTTSWGTVIPGGWSSVHTCPYYPVFYFTMPSCSTLVPSYCIPASSGYTTSPKDYDTKMTAQPDGRIPYPVIGGSNFKVAY